MDVVLHPDFEENGWVHLSCHKTVGEDAGAVTLAQGTWNVTSLQRRLDGARIRRRPCSLLHGIFGPVTESA
jgi:hypothetical protein